MLLHSLLEPFTAAAVPAGIVAQQLTLDSRQVTTGSVFFACVGTQQHGLAYAVSAQTAGAVAVVYDPAGVDSVPELSVPCIPVEQLSARLADVAARFYGNPADALTLVGVTGTDGKSSVVNLWAQLMRHCGQVVASLGTLGLDLGSGPRAGTHTTPDPISLQACLAEARNAGCSALAMEVSSHAIAQGRVDGLRFSHVAMTNLGRDHLDYHQSVAEYHATKRRLLAWPGVETVHINGDAALVRRALEQVETAAATRVYGTAIDARWRAEDVLPSARGLQLTLSVAEQKAQLEIPLYGEFNVGNVLAAASLAEACGADVADLIAAIPSLQTVPGRMQALQLPGAPVVIVDYAHTPQALEAALQAARAHRPQNLVCVFGCGGDRDRGKRPLMAAAAEKLADQVFLTDDNPRTEDPEQIFAETRAGFRSPRAVIAIHDRAQAIQQAVREAGPEDMVVVAGKGHEDCQLVGEQKFPFSDVETVRAALRPVVA